ncbi:DUF4227 family protein [Aneurinibacillus terranovensis]|uniref:DUF4227 family protein n=1 Tax=Aneurinibacillus terranovensis TaxID=278991 RepID=UPI003CCC024F
MIECVRLLIIFVVCTFIFYHAVSYVNEVIRPANPYKEPEGKAVKVAKFHSSDEISYKNVKERLFAFYWYGE